MDDLSTKPIKPRSHVLLLGYDNFVRLKEVVAVCHPKSASSKSLRDLARQRGRLVDMTHGKKTRAMVITQSNHIFLSAVSCETLQARVEALEGRE